MKNKTIKLLEYLYTKLSGFYIVQKLNKYDIESATGQRICDYTPSEMLLLKDELEEKTYIGDDWTTVINDFDDQLER